MQLHADILFGFKWEKVVKFQHYLATMTVNEVQLGSGAVGFGPGRGGHGPKESRFSVGFATFSAGVGPPLSKRAEKSTLFPI